MKVVILIEHKSYVDKNTPIQTLYYVANGMMQQVIRKEALQVIIPVVFYHGKQKWEYVNLEELLDSDFKVYIPSFKTIFVDLYRISDESLAMISNVFLSSTLLTQKYSREPQKLADKLEAIFKALNPRQRNLFRPLTVYFINLVKLDKNVILEKIDTLAPKIKDEIMSTYDMILQEGMEKGMEKQNLNIILVGLKEGFSLDSLSKLTGYSLDKIRKIMKDNKLS